MTVVQQAQAFAVMAVCGVCVGAAQDLLRMLGRNGVARGAADLVLGIICAASVIAAALALRCDAFRLYTLLGVTAGWTIYAATLGRIVRVLCRKFMEMSKKVRNSANNGKMMQEN